MQKLYSIQFKKPVYELFIGDFYVTRQKNVMISTLLGPCIAVCLADKNAGVVGMNHFLLPGRSANGDLRYGFDSMDMLISEMINQGADIKNMSARFFGGGRVQTEISTDFGWHNSSFIDSYLMQRNIPVEARDTGNCYSRRIYFCTSTYTVYLQKNDSKKFSETTGKQYMTFL